MSIAGWDEVEFLRSFTGHTVFDIGAQTGAMVELAFAGRFKQIIAVEAAEESYNILAGHNDYPGLVPVLAAVCDHEGTLELGEQPGPMQVYTLTDGSPHWGELIRWRTVPCTTVDALTTKYGPPELLKIDTEGWELPIINGALETMKHARPSLDVEIHSAEAGSAIFDIITQIYGTSPERGENQYSRPDYYWLFHREA